MHKLPTHKDRCVTVVSGCDEDGGDATSEEMGCVMVRVGIGGASGLCVPQSRRLHEACHVF